MKIEKQKRKGKKKETLTRFIHDLSTSPIMSNFSQSPLDIFSLPLTLPILFYPVLSALVHRTEAQSLELIRTKLMLLLSLVPIFAPSLPSPFFPSFSSLLFLPLPHVPVPTQSGPKAPLSRIRDNLNFGENIYYYIE